MTKLFPLCEGGSCPKKNTCERYSEVIHEDDLVFSHPPFKSGKCEFYVGLEESALREYLKDLLNVKDKSNGHAGTEV